MGECVFCNVVGGEAPASRTYEDDLVLAIMSAGPVARGHVLVLPKRHLMHVDDLDDRMGMHLFNVTLRMAQAVRRGMPCKGVNLFLADGAARGTAHLHLHVYPRVPHDPFDPDAARTGTPSRAELDRLAARIRRAYVSL